MKWSFLTTLFLIFFVLVLDVDIVKAKKKTAHPHEKDPCEISTGSPCDPQTESCVKNGKKHECVCKRGYRKNTPDEECQMYDLCPHINKCSVHATCINLVPDYKCVCKNGYVGNGFKCEDVNECSDAENNQCHNSSVCINQDGGYTCQCRTGYEFADNSAICEKIFPLKNIILAVVVAGVPLILCIALTIFLCRRRKQRIQKSAKPTKTTKEESYVHPEVQNDDENVLFENQPLLPEVASFYDPDNNMDMKGLPPSESLWSEWPDYDDVTAIGKDYNMT